MTKFTRIAIFVVAAPLFASPALATPTLNFAIQSTPLATPTFEFKFKGGKYVWEQKSATTQFSASADTNDNKLLWATDLNIDSLGVGGAANFTGNVPTNVTSWSQSGSITFPAGFLTSYQANFAAFCESNGGTKQVVKHGLSIIFSARQGYLPKPKGWPKQAPQQIDSEKWASRTVIMPVKIVCGPKPAKETPRPGGLVQQEPDFRVKSIALNYGGVTHKTRPNAATECKQARLTVTLQTSKAGVVDFRLRKKIGNGPTQSKNVQVYAKFDGNAHFVASHQENVSVTKTDLVQAMAEDLVNSIGLTTGWKDVTLRCQDIGGGFASTPNNSNPDGLPTKPKAPKRNVGGPSQEGAGANPTHAPFRPVIAPAKLKTSKPVIAPAKIKTAPTGRAPRPIKTAPAPAKPQRLGGFSFGVERQMK